MNETKIKLESLNDYLELSKKINSIEKIKDELITVDIEIPKKAKEILNEVKDYIGEYIYSGLKKSIDMGAELNIYGISSIYKKGGDDSLKEFAEQMVKNQVIIAGGFISDLVINKELNTKYEPKDLDIFVSERITNIIKNISEKTEEVSNTEINDTGFIEHLFEGYREGIFTDTRTVHKNTTKVSPYDWHTSIDTVLKGRIENLEVDMVFTRMLTKKNAYEIPTIGKTNGLSEALEIISEFDLTFRQFFFSGDVIYGLKQSIEDIRNKEVRVYYYSTPVSTCLRILNFSDRYGFDFDETEIKFLYYRAAQSVLIRIGEDGKLGKKESRTGVITKDSLIKLLEMDEIKRCLQKNKDDTEVVQRELGDDTYKAIESFLEKLDNDPSNSEYDFKFILKEIIFSQAEMLENYHHKLRKETNHILENAIEVATATNGSKFQENIYLGSCIGLFSNFGSMLEERETREFLYRNNIFELINKEYKIKLSEYNFLDFLKEAFPKEDPEALFVLMDELFEELSFITMFQSNSDRDYDELNEVIDEKLHKKTNHYGSCIGAINPYSYDKTYKFDLDIYEEKTITKKEITQRIKGLIKNCEGNELKRIQKSKSAMISNDLVLIPNIRAMIDNTGMRNGITLLARFEGKEIDDIQSYVENDYGEVATIREVELLKYTTMSLYIKNEKAYFDYDEIDLRIGHKRRAELAEFLTKELNYNFTSEENINTKSLAF